MSMTSTRRSTKSSLQDEADLAVRTKRFVIEDGPALAYLQRLAVANQLVVVMTDVGSDRFVAHPMYREIRAHQNVVALGAEHAHVRDHSPRARSRILRPRRLAG